MYNDVFDSNYFCSKYLIVHFIRLFQVRDPAE